MRGPERCGLVSFTIDDIEERDEQGWNVQPSDYFVLRLSGTLRMGITWANHTLPRNIWDRQRDGGFLSDGMTRVGWIINDSNIRDRPGVRRFDIIFGRPSWVDCIGDWYRDYYEWRELVSREWMEYLEAPRPRLTMAYIL